jgi:hypothetical protein
MLYPTLKLNDKHEMENHSIPVFEVLEVGGKSDLCVAVTPLMCCCDDPWFENMGEVVDFLGQVLEVGHSISYGPVSGLRFSGSRG